MFVRKEKDGVDHRPLLDGCHLSLMSVEMVSQTVFLGCHFCFVVGVAVDEVVVDMVLDSSVLAGVFAGRSLMSFV